MKVNTIILIFSVVCFTCLNADVIERTNFNILEDSRLDTVRI